MPACTKLISSTSDHADSRQCHNRIQIKLQIQIPIVITLIRPQSQTDYKRFPQLHRLVNQVFHAKYDIRLRITWNAIWNQEEISQTLLCLL